MNTSRAASETAETLLRGNDRFREGLLRPSRIEKVSALHADRDTKPIAALLTCSDLCFSPEEIFDLVPGQLYVMQSAANTADASEVAGAVLANRQYGVDLVVVLGHSPCQLADAYRSCRPARMDVISRELLASEHLLEEAGNRTVGDTCRAHAMRMAEILRENLREELGIRVQPAFLDEHSGLVEFLPAAPPAGLREVM